LTQFNDLGLAENILRAITKEGYKTPTPIQAKVIPAMLTGRDVLGIAQTGTGKTASFVLPILQRIVESRHTPKSKHCTALILTPTRELSVQIANNIKIYSQFINASSAIVVGGMKPGPQIKALAKGVDIVIATPGRLQDHMNSGVIQLDSTTCVVLDEADQMLDLGFVPTIRKIFGKLPKKRQSIMMSATMPRPIRKLASDFQTDPQEISVAPVSRPIERIKQSARHIAAGNKRDALVDILGDGKNMRVIVFTRTKRGADKVNRQLIAANMSSAVIHGNKSQTQRDKALAAFKSGRISILVATDIAARGIDIDDVSHVINYDLPQVAEVYVHRIGRTARAGRSGIAVSLCAPEERGMLSDIEHLIGNKLYVEAGYELKDDGKGPKPKSSQKKKSGSKKRPSRWKPKSANGEARKNTGAPGKPKKRRRPKSKSSPRAA